MITIPSPVDILNRYDYIQGFSKHRVEQIVEKIVAIINDPMRSRDHRDLLRPLTFVFNDSEFTAGSDGGDWLQVERLFKQAGWTTTLTSGAPTAISSARFFLNLNPVPRPTIMRPPSTQS